MIVVGASDRRGRFARWFARLMAVVLLAVAAVPSASVAAEAPSPPRPDIVVIMLDDVAADSMPALLARMPTLRSLFVEQGVRFPNAFGQDPLCCPGRAGFLTGLTSRHHRVRTNDARLLDPRVTIATALHDVGYHTMVVGKYLNGVELLRDRTPPGWDRVAISSGGYRDWTMYRQGARSYHGGSAADYSTDVFARQSVRWLRSAPADKPRFVWLTPYATHGDPVGASLFPRPADRFTGARRCAGIGYRKTPAWNEADVGDRTDWVRSHRRLGTADGVSPKGWPLRRACESLLSVDAWVKRVVEIQTQQGRLDRTLFVLMADNGMSWGDHRHLGKNVPWATPIPLYLYWPGTLGTRPSTNEAFVLNIDLAPTFAELAGAELGPYPNGPPRPDGRSLLATILAGAPTALARTGLFEEHREQDLPRMRWSALRTTSTHPCGLWHYSEWEDGISELFDMVADPWELTNVAAQHPAIVAQLRRELTFRKQGLVAGSTTCGR